MNNIPISKPNIPILIEYQTLRNAISSAVEVEVGTVHHNDKAAILMGTIMA